jgi:NAD-dependent deacetylase
MKKKLVIFSGAGISAESGIKTFRGADGLWENYRIEDVATPEAFEVNPALVLDFYNQRRAQVVHASPNTAHIAIANAENIFDVSVITQNIDDLHERAGSSNVLHLHGEIRKSRSVCDSQRLYSINGTTLNLGDLDPKGKQLRPHVVWFGESVPMIEKVIPIIQAADILIVVGTSLNVYPAAGLVDFAPASAKKYLVDPHQSNSQQGVFNLIKEPATTGIPKVLLLISNPVKF